MSSLPVPASMNMDQQERLEFPSLFGHGEGDHVWHILPILPRTDAENMNVNQQSEESSMCDLNVNPSHIAFAEGVLVEDEDKTEPSPSDDLEDITVCIHTREECLCEYAGRYEKIDSTLSTRRALGEVRHRLEGIDRLLSCDLINKQEHVETIRHLRDHHAFVLTVIREVISVENEHDPVGDNVPLVMNLYPFGIRDDRCESCGHPGEILLWIDLGSGRRHVIHVGVKSMCSKCI